MTTVYTCTVLEPVIFNAGGAKSVEVYYSEGEGRLVSVSPPPGSDQPPMSQVLTSKLVADSLMWQQTFRNDR